MNVNKASYQRIFDRVVNHLRTQKIKATTATGVCIYRAPVSKLKCAVGCLIPDRKYKPSIEGLAVNEGPVYSLLGLKSTSKKILFLKKIQLIHDNHDPSQWEGLFKSFAHKHKLMLKKK